MQDKIIAAIAAYLEKETNVKYGFLKQPERVEFGGSLNPGHYTHTGFCQEIATEIYTAIAPMVEAGEVESEVKVDRDELYTEKFKEWREKYFKQQSNRRRFISKSNGVLYDDFGLEQKFKRAYDESAIK